jgi:cytoskeleton protein RodZ
MSHTHTRAEPVLTKHRPRPDGSVDPVGEAGWYLNRERERRGLSLHQIAEILDIHESHIDGIERGDLTKLPARDEALAMIGTYGQYLGFDPEPLVEHYAEVIDRPQVQRPKPLRAPPPLSSAKVIPFAKALKLLSSRRGMTIAGAGLGIILLCGLVQSWMAAGEEPVSIAEAISVYPSMDGALPPLEEADAPETSEAEAQATLPEADTLPTAALPPIPEGSAKITVTETPLEDDQAIVEAGPPIENPGVSPLETDALTAFIAKQLEGEPGFEATAAKPLPEKQGGLAPVEPAQAAAGPSRLVLDAKGPVWIRVEDSRGNVVVSKTMRMGDSYEVPNRDDLVIISRDGGLIGYSVDGVDKGTLGSPGEILVGRSLNIARLLNNKG